MGPNHIAVTRPHIGVVPEIGDVPARALNKKALSRRVGGVVEKVVNHRAAGDLGSERIGEGDR